MARRSGLRTPAPLLLLKHEVICRWYCNSFFRAETQGTVPSGLLIDFFSIPFPPL